jgi:hypothetical protein
MREIYSREAKVKSKGAQNKLIKILEVKNEKLCCV